MSTVIDRPPRHKAGVQEPSKASSAVREERQRGPSPVVLLALLALTLLAGAIRVKGLDAPDGRMDTDETRLALATDSVLRTGLPVMPSGRIYTRGLLNSYLIAPSFALLGRHDFAARLPSALAGALLVPVVFLLGRAYSGAAAGLAAATFVALATPLVEASRNAWLPSIFLLLFTAGVYCCYRGFVERRGRWQVAGAVYYCLAVLSYEFAVLLLGGLGFYLVWRSVRGDRSWYRGPTTLVALGLFLGGLGLFVVLALALRAGTLTGPLGEVRAYLTPRLALNVSFYRQYVLADYLVLVGVAMLGLPLLAKARPRGTIFLFGLLALACIIPTLIIQNKVSPRYILPLLPLLAVLASAATVRVARLASRRLNTSGVLRTALPIMALVVMLEVALRADATAVAQLTGQPPGPTWVQVIQEQDLQGDDLLITDWPTVVRFYIGRDDFYIPLQGAYQRYAYRAEDAIRSVYTGSVLLQQPGDFERLVERTHAGQTAWVLGREENLPERTRALEPALWPSLVRSADRIIRTQDGWVLLKLTLPRRG